MVVTLGTAPQKEGAHHPKFWYLFTEGGKEFTLREKGSDERTP
jgi:hypothetical protein